ncbi:MAG: hypothetical protein K2L07_10660 [Lachnospiraceae bacterium]|nr:hypothetical protein [Lachnospiraceae bacterium]
MYFEERMFNPTYVSRDYYNQIQAQINQYNFQQNIEVGKAVKATHDLCGAVKKMDESHQQQAFYACLAAMAQEFGWQ